MARYEPVATARPREAVLETNKVIRNTYTLLSMTLLFSAVMAMVGTMVQLSPGASLICMFAALGLVWFVLPRTANSSAGLITVFAFTGLLGFSLGPTLLYYLSLSNGPQVIGMVQDDSEFLSFLGSLNSTPNLSSPDADF